MRALLALATATAALTAPQRCEVTLKIAMDRNGAVDDLGDKAERFTSPASLDAVHRLRRHCDAVLVGASTVARDDPSLTVRRVPLAPRTAQPLRVVLGSAPADAGLLNDGLETVLFSKDDGLDGAVRVHARAREKFVRRVGVELRPVDAVLARATAASERRARGDDGVAVTVARREKHGDAAPEERVGDGRRRRRDVRRYQ